MDPQVPEAGNDDELWDAYDIAEHYGWSVGTARTAIGRWRVTAGLKADRKDAITGADRYRASQVREAHQMDAAQPPP